MDPGFALGVVSLGITICHDLLGYYRKWKEYPKDIEAVAKSIQFLLELLYQIKAALDVKLGEGAQATLITRVNGAAQNCTDSLKDLQEHFQSLKPFDDAEGIRAKLTGVRRKVNYPFQKQSLETLERRVKESRTNLMEILNVLQVRQNIEINHTVGEILRTQANDRVEKWLAAPLPSVNQDINLEQRHSGTGLWFLASTDYEQWKIQDRSFLWLQGSAGSGKSVLCSATIDDLEQNYVSRQGSLVCYYYFTFTDEVKQKVSGFLKSILLQLSKVFVGSPTPLECLYAKRGGATPSDKDLLQAIQQTLFVVPQAFLVIDALDECSETDKLIKTINHIKEWRMMHLHFLITSRDEPNLKRGLSCEQVKTVLIQNVGLDHDIQIYVASVLSQDPSLQRWQTLHEDIRNELLRQADGM